MPENVDITIHESERRLILMALACLSMNAPNYEPRLRALAGDFLGVEIFDDFRARIHRLDGESVEDTP